LDDSVRDDIASRCTEQEQNTMEEHKRLPAESLTNVDQIQRPAPKSSVNAFSPAMELLTDFEISRPHMIEQSITVATAKGLMTSTHVRLNLVIDKDERFKGVVTLADLVSIKVMQAKEKTGLAMEELSVGEVMTRKDSLHAIDIRQFHHATIGDILLTMKSFGDQHVLVLDSARNSIRGIVSSSDIARALHESVYICERANSFADIYRAVRS
jgi:CBS-domain-containing membrane protein